MYKKIISDLQNSYNHAAPEREQAPLQTWKAQERQGFLAALQQAGKEKLLEIGAGTGRDSLFFQEQGFEVVCTDLSPEMVALCRAKGLDAHTMDFLNLDFPLESFDAVYGLNCLLHVPKSDLKNILQTIQKLMQPEGLFFMGVYGGLDFEGIWEQDSYTPKRFFSFYTDESMQQIVGEFFEIQSFKVVPVEGLVERHFQSMILKRK